MLAHKIGRLVLNRAVNVHDSLLLRAALVGVFGGRLDDGAAVDDPLAGRAGFAAPVAIRVSLEWRCL